MNLIYSDSLQLFILLTHLDGKLHLSSQRKYTVNITINKNTISFIGMSALLICSFIITLSFDSNLSDGLSITVSVLSAISLFCIAAVMLFEAVLDICNPSQ